MEQTPDKAIILVVDDVSVMRNVVVKGLTACGCKVLEADDGFTAFDVIKKNRPHVILLDVMMPKMSGLEFLKKYKAEEANKDVDIIMCTAKGERNNVLEAIKMGACDYIVKPYKIQVVIEKIFKVLEKRYGTRFSNMLGQEAAPKSKAKAEAGETPASEPAPEGTTPAKETPAPADNPENEQKKQEPPTA